MHEGWRLEAKELIVEKRYEEAEALIRAAIEEGDMAAYVMLAKLEGRIDLPRSEADRLIDYVEANMDPADIWAHLELSGAYDIRLGNIPYEEKAVRFFDHLVKAAELDAGAIVSLRVARIYRTGALCVDANEAEAIRWYKRAIEQGSVEAVHELQDLYTRQGRKRTASGQVRSLRAPEAES